MPEDSEPAVGLAAGEVEPVGRPPPYCGKAGVVRVTKARKRKVNFDLTSSDSMERDFMGRDLMRYDFMANLRDSIPPS